MVSKFGFTTSAYCCLFVCEQKDGTGAGVIDIDKTTTTLEQEKPTSGGLYVPGKDRVVYVPQERKSRLGIVLF